MINVIIATINANKSDTAKLVQTPSTPHNLGKINRVGIKNINCRVNDRNIDIPGLPIAWKKFCITTCPPMTAKNMKLILNPVVEISINVASVANNDEISRGISSATISPIVVTNIPTTKPIFKVRFTLSQLLAP